MEEVVLASSSVDAGISCWDLRTGAEHLSYKSCTAPPHGLISVADRFLAASQLLPSSANHGSILFWPWHKPQAETKSFPAEQIRPLVSNHDGTYLLGGGVSGYIYIWEVATGKLMRRWHGHYRALTCLALSDDESILISGSDDGSVRVWFLFMIFDDVGRQEAKSLYEYSFSEHTLRVTDVVTGYGGNRAIIVSASEDRTCKVWCLSEGKLVRNIVFPSIIDAIALDPGELVFYAGGRNGKIYIAALNTVSTTRSKYGMHIIDSLSDHSKAVTCLVLGENGNSLVSGSEDGMVRVWDTKSRSLVRVFKYGKGPINNVIVARKPLSLNSWTSQASSGKKHGSLLPPPLGRYSDSNDDNTDIKVFIASMESANWPVDASYMSEHVMDKQIGELQLGSAATSEMENARLKLECQKTRQMVEQWEKMYAQLHDHYVSELLNGNTVGGSNGNSA